jgi:4-amino-4-deoxy-L-arabinose transferase-like glycosyltransferase
MLSIPQAWLTALVTSGGASLSDIQRTHDYHPIFILTRVVQLLAGLATILIVWWILIREYDPTRALLGAACVALFPLSIVWFPNLHHDSILAPFVLLTAYMFYRRQYAWAGVCFGLALASKNVAVFLIPALLAFAVWNAWDSGGGGLGGNRRQRLTVGLRSWAFAMFLGGVVLLPFANPISYAREVATPIIHRKYDTRGEDLRRYTLSGKLDARKRQGTKAVRSDLRPEVRAINSAVGLQEVWFLFAALGVLALLSRHNRPLARMCLLVLLLSVLLAPVFGHDLNYRMLMFVPFFAILAVDISRPKPLLGLLAVLLAIDLVYVIDPMTATTIHLPVERQAVTAP